MNKVFMKNKSSLFVGIVIFVFGIAFSFPVKASITFSNVGAGATEDSGVTVTNPTIFNLGTPIATRYLRIAARNDNSFGYAGYIELRNVKAWAGGETNVLKSIHSGGSARVVKYNAYNSARVYSNDDLSMDCSGSWYPQGSLCDEDLTADSKIVSSKSNSASGATWPTDSADGTGVLVIDMGSVQNLSELRVFQMFSDGKTTQIHFAYHPESSGTSPEWNDDGWLNFDGTSAVVGVEEGSSGNPYQISTCVELQEMNNDLDAYYILKNDIDCSGIANFIPIGNLENQFAGNFNGADFDISNLTINRPTEDYVGLFGYVNKSSFTISNVDLIDANIIGKKRVGGLVGFASYEGIEINNCSVSGSVSGASKVGGLLGSSQANVIINNSHNSATVSGNYTGATSENGIGGMVGVASGLSIESSYNTGNVNAVGTLYVGGLIGSASNLAISQSYNSGNITGNSATHTVGGLAGAATGLMDGNPMIQNSYNTGNVSGYQRIGGLIGFAPEAYILNSYNSGSVTATYSADADDVGGNGAGGLVGINSMEGLSGPFPATNNALRIYNSFNVGTISASKNSGGILGFAATIDADRITWPAGSENEWNRPEKTVELLNNFYYAPTESLNCNDQIEASGCDPKNSVDYFKNTAGVAPFVDGEDPWDFTEVWQTRSDGYPIFIGQDITEEEQGENTPEEISSNPERARIIFWSAYKYVDENSNLCQNKIKLTIKGKHFDSDAKVYIGTREAISVDRKSSKKIIAKFCLDKLLDNKADHQKNIYVQNPDTDKTKAKKQIDLDNILSELSSDDLSMQSTEGIKNIQMALVKLGYLDAQYITGTYGSITTEAVKKFQADHGIEQTGTVGPLTRAALEKEL